jgi:hypothetical protein
MVRCNLCVSGGASPFYTGSGNQYEDAVLPSGMAIGEPHEALDCACGLYLSDPSAWLRTPPRTTSPDISVRSAARSRGSYRVGSGSFSDCFATVPSHS